MSTAKLIGSDPNGLSAAIVFATACLTATVFERNAQIGGACSTAEATLPDFRLLGIAGSRQDCSVFGDDDCQQACGFGGACILADQMITSWGLEERVTCFIDSGRPCCGSLRTNPAGQYVREDAAGVMVSTGFSAGWVLDHLRRQSLSGHVWKLDRGDLPYAFMILHAKRGAHSKEGGEHASEQWSLAV